MNLTTTLKTAAWYSSMAIVAGTLQADWQLVTDFSTETRDELSIWKRFPPGGTLYLDGLDPVDATNRALYMDPEEANEGMANIIHLAYDLPDGGVAPDGKASLKFDFLAYGSAMQFLLGLSDVPKVTDESLGQDFGRLVSPAAWSDYETVNRMRTTFDVRDGNQYLMSDINVPTLEWMTIYQYIDNETDLYETYIKLPGETELTPIVIGGQSQFLFRNGGDNPLVNVFFAATKGTADAWPDAWAVDNVYIDLDGRNAELPGAVVVETAFGLPVPTDGWVDTGDWFGFVNASFDPYFFQADFGTWFFANESAVDLEKGGWGYFFYDGAPAWDQWTADGNGWVDTGAFMGWINVSQTGYIYSLTLEQWMAVPNPTASTGGFWAYVFPYTPPPVLATYEITNTGTAPTIDGTLTAGEWADANSYELSYDSLITTGIGTSLNGLTSGPASATAYITATAQGLYLGFDVTDGDIWTAQEFGAAGNGHDGVQLGITLNPTPASRNDSTVLFDFNPRSLMGGTQTGPASLFARWGLAGYDATWGIEQSAVVAGAGYTMEIMIPWTLLQNLTGVDNDLSAGSTMAFTLLLIDVDGTGTSRDILWDTGAGSFTVGTVSTYPIAVIAEQLQ